MRRFVIGALSVASSLAFLAATVTPETAAPAIATREAAAVSPHSDPRGATVTTPLFADCSRVSVSGREYARRHGIDVCGASTTPPDAALRTEAVGGEECGALTLTATSWGGGVVALAWQTSSLTGPIARVDLALSVSGTAGATVHHFAGRTGAAPAREGMVGYVGQGLAVFSMSGTVETATGICSLSSAPARIGVR